MKLKVGIAGYGKMGKIRAETIDKYPQIDLAYIYDPKQKKIDRSNVVLCDDFEQLLNTDVDAIFIAGYVQHAAEYTVRALNAGKHVFCEKPPGMCLKELDGVQRSLTDSKKVLKYGFNHRYHYSVIEAKKLLESGAIGDIVTMRGVYGKAGSLDFEKNWRNYKKFSGGGILIDQGIHMLDLFIYLTNDYFECVGAIVRTLHWDIECEDNAMVLLHTKKGTIASLHSSATQWKHKFMLEIFGTNGYLILDGILSSTMSYAPEKMVVGMRKDERVDVSMGKPVEIVYVYEKDDSWSMELDEFLNAISGRGKIRNGTLNDSMNVMALLESIYRKNALPQI